jgi:peroxiredoxin
MTLLRDRSTEFESAGVQVFGVSRDSPWSHRAWKEALELDFPLLSDWTGDAVRALGITQVYRGLPDVAERSALLVERGSVVRGAWRYGSREVPDFDEALTSARNLNSPSS